MMPLVVPLELRILPTALPLAATPLAAAPLAAAPLAGEMAPRPRGEMPLVSGLPLTDGELLAEEDLEDGAVMAL